MLKRSEKSTKGNRLFIGLFPSETKHLLHLQAQYQREIRPLKAENLHLTIHFLGDVNQDRFCDIMRVMDHSVSAVARMGDIDCAFSNITSVGGIGRPYHHALAAWLDADFFSRLHLEMKPLLQDIGLKLEKRQFKPHITLGYFPKKNGKKRVERRRLEAPFKLGKCSLKLINSVLAPGGSLFQELYKINLF